MCIFHRMLMLTQHSDFCIAPLAAGRISGGINAGDFNHAELKTVLPKLHQHVKCPTRGDKTLDKVYSNIKHGYRAIQLPHLGQSDHLSRLLAPAYTPPQETCC